MTSLVQQGTQVDPTQNPLSHYYLHPSDHASIKLVIFLLMGLGMQIGEET